MDKSSRRTALVVVGLVIVFSGLIWARARQVNGWIRAISHHVGTQDAVEAAKKLVDKKKLVKVFKKRPLQAKQNAVVALQLLATLEPESRLGKRAANYLVELLEDMDVPIRQEAARSLGRLGKVALKPLLEDGLTNADKDVRRNSSQALIEIGYQALPELVRALETGAAPVRVGAAEVIGELGSERGIAPLIATLGFADDEDVRLTAKDALVKIGAPAVPALIAALEDANYLIRMYAADGLGEIGPPTATPAEEALLKHLQQDDHRLVRISSAYALGKLGRPAAVEPLIKVLAEDDKDLREAAAVSLGLLKDTRAITPLMALLRDEVPAVREQAAEALGRIGPQSEPLLVRELREGPPGTREAAALALGRLGRGVLPLTQAVQDQEASVRQRAAWALGQSRSPAAIPPLIAALGDPDSHVSYAARDALANLGKLAVPALIQAFANPNRLIAHYAEEALVAMEDPPVPELKAALQDPREAIRLHAALALAALGTAEATEPLKALEKGDRSERVRWVAKRTLRKLSLTAE